MLERLMSALKWPARKNETPRLAWLQEMALEQMTGENPIFLEHTTAKRLAGTSPAIQRLAQQHGVQVEFCVSQTNTNQRENCGIMAIAWPENGALSSKHAQKSLDSLRRATGISELQTDRDWSYQGEYVVYSCVWICDGRRSVSSAYELWCKNEVATLLAGWLNWKKDQIA